ncbi:fatty acid-binding protein-like [Ptychodera flava]|uniref:fatty acid-binding protein-like n=1 Tax=Ptychodera flava TaxID=63121 RepID=UPI00396A0D6F
MSSFPEALLGQWTHVRDSDFDDLLEVMMQGMALPLPFARSLVSSCHKAIIGREGQFYTIKTAHEGHTHTLKFKIGEEFEEVCNPMGKKRKSVAVVEDGNLIIRAVDESDMFKTEYKVSGDEMEVILTDDDESATRYYKR